MTTDMTTALCDAYFRKPPTRDWLPVEIDGNWQTVLACHIADRPKRKINADAFHDPRTINAEVRVEHVEAEWQASGIGLEGSMAKTIFVDGVARRLRGDGDYWRERAQVAQKDLKRAEQLRRVRDFKASKVDAKPSDYMTAEDRARFLELAKEAMANICHLTTFLPYTQIMGPRWAQRLLEMVEREMVTCEEAGRRTTGEIEAECAALGGGVDEITNSKIERLERRRTGLRFQWHHCKLLFAAWREQYDEVCGEHEALSASLPGVEFDGRTWDYVSLRDRVERRQKLKREDDKAWQQQRQMLRQLPMQDYYKWLSGKTGYQPRKGNGFFNAARPEVAQPIYEPDFGDEDE